jgi:hypothetical protein
MYRCELYFTIIIGKGAHKIRLPCSFSLFETDKTFLYADDEVNGNCSPFIFLTAVHRVQFLWAVSAMNGVTIISFSAVAQGNILQVSLSLYIKL